VLTAHKPDCLTVLDWKALCTCHESNDLEELFYPEDNKRNPDFLVNLDDAQYEIAYEHAISSDRHFRNPAEVIGSIRSYGTSCRAILEHLAGWLGLSITVHQKQSVKPPLHHYWRSMWKQANPNLSTDDCDQWALDLQKLVLDHLIENHTSFKSKALEHLLRPETLNNEHYAARFQHSIWHDLLVSVQKTISPLSFQHPAVTNYASVALSPFNIEVTHSLTTYTADLLHDHASLKALPYLMESSNRDWLEKQLCRVITEWIKRASVNELRRQKDAKTNPPNDSASPSNGGSSNNVTSSQLKKIIRTLEHLPDQPQPQPTTVVDPRMLHPQPQPTTVVDSRMLQPQATSIPTIIASRPMSSQPERESESELPIAMSFTTPPSYQPNQASSSVETRCSTQPLSSQNIIQPASSYQPNQTSSAETRYDSTESLSSQGIIQPALSHSTPTSQTTAPTATPSQPMERKKRGRPRLNSHLLVSNHTLQKRKFV